MEPDLQRLRTDLESAGQQLSRLPNLPIANIAQEIQALRNDVNAQRAHTDEQTQALRNEMQALRNDIINVILRGEHNATARIHNSRVIDALSPLMGLHDFNNQPIPNLPATGRALTLMPAAEVNNLLQALQIDPAPNLDAQRNQLRNAMGLLVLT